MVEALVVEQGYSWKLRKREREKKCEIICHNRCTYTGWQIIRSTGTGTGTGYGWGTGTGTCCK